MLFAVLFVEYSLNFNTNEACSKIIETITILSKRLNIIQNNLHSHQLLHIWGIGLNDLTAACNGYDPVAFLRLIPPLHQSMSHNVGVHCTVSLIYCRLNEHTSINSFASKLICVNNDNTDTILACCGRLNEISAQNSELYGYTSQVSEIRTMRRCDLLMCTFQVSFMTIKL